MAVRRWTTGAVATVLLATLCALGGSLAVPPPPAAAADPALSLVQIDAGYQSTCGVASDGLFECWGADWDGALALGLSTTTHPRSQAGLTSSTVLAGKTIAQVSSGGDGSRHGGCALSTDGVLACWGDRYLRGDGSAPEVLREPSPVTVAGTVLAGRTIVEVSVGNTHACAVTSDGIAACWGANRRGQLGDGTSTDRFTPSGVVTAGTPFAGKQIAHISAGQDHTCAVTTDGLGGCWGWNGGGRLGSGTEASSPSSPVALATAGTVLAGKSLVAISAGAAVGATSTDGHSCALASDGTAACWGGNRFGQLGDGTTTSAGPGLSPRKPTAIATTGTPFAGKAFAQIHAGTDRTCAVTTDGLLGCWGNGREGLLGDGDLAGVNRAVTKPQAVTVAGTPLAGATIAAVTSGRSHTCARATNGVAACWGQNDLGYLGDGSTTDSGVPRGVLPREEVPSAPNGVTVSAGNGRATVRWSAPTSSGATPVTTYRIALYRAGRDPQLAAVTATPNGASRSAVVVSLVTTDTYRVRVVAENATGTKRGTWSALSAPFNPRAPFTPFASSSALVNRLFADIVGRAPTTAERTQWVRDIDDGAKTKAELADFLRRSSENATFVDPTARLYRAVLGRAPDAGGLDFWIGRRRSGSWSLTRMADFFANSAEFKAKYGNLSNSAFVSQIYADVLGRPATSSDLAYWTAELVSGRRSRGQLVIGFSESPEYKAKQRESTDVSVAHILLLDRAPTSAETSAWVTAQKGGTSHTALLLGLLNSPAYQDHIT